MRHRSVKCECAAPDREQYLHHAAATGHLKLQNSSKIKELAFEKVTKAESGYSSNKLTFHAKEIFVDPPAYTAAVKKHQAELKQIEDRNEAFREFAERIIDAVNLNQFEDGQDAIAQVQSYEIE